MFDEMGGFQGYCVQSFRPRLAPFTPAPPFYGESHMSFRPLRLQPDSSHQPTETQRARVRVAAKPNAGRQLLVALAFLAAGLLAIFATRASGQQANFAYDSIPLHERLADEALVKRLQTEAKTFASTGKGQANLVNAYFGYYITAKMTAPDGVRHISELTDEMTTLLLRAQRSNRTQVWQQLSGFVFNAMKKVAEGNYHPAARINAALLLSRLDRQPANNQARTPPIPLILSTRGSEFFKCLKL